MKFNFAHILWSILKEKVKVMHILIANIYKMVTDIGQTFLFPYNMKSYKSWAFDWNIQILTWATLKMKVKAIYILMANIIKMITDRENITIAIKYEVA